MSKTGHAFIKERMRAENALYGGECRHHYFREFAYCDSGMIPWLLVKTMCRARRAPLRPGGGPHGPLPLQRRNQPQIARPRCGHQARRGTLSH